MQETEISNSMMEKRNWLTTFAEDYDNNWEDTDTF